MGRSFLLSCAVIVLVSSASCFLGASVESGTVAREPRKLSEASTAEQCTPVSAPQPVTVELNPYTLEAKFDCGIKGNDATHQLEPDTDAAKGKCCDSTGENCARDISDAVGVNGSTSVDASTKIITVKLDNTPTKIDQRLYFKCSKKGTQDKCIVTVAMPKAFTDSQCNFDRNVQLPPIAQPNTEATFECGGTVAPEPNDTQVFKGPECTGTASKLSDLVPGATLVDAGKGNYTLKVAALPAEAQNLCFKCDYPDPRKHAEEISTSTCKVTIAVAGTSKTTTASTTSAAEGIAVPSLAAVAFAFFSTAGLHY